MATQRLVNDRQSPRNSHRRKRPNTLTPADPVGITGNLNMATVKSCKHQAKRHQPYKVEIADAFLSLARSNDPATHEPKAYHIRFTPTEGDSAGREFSIDFTPTEWARIERTWQEPVLVDDRIAAVQSR